MRTDLVQSCNSFVVYHGTRINTSYQYSSWPFFSPFLSEFRIFRRCLRLETVYVVLKQRSFYTYQNQIR